jgi:hypothetical protein
MCKQERKAVYVLAGDERIQCEYVPQPGWSETLCSTMLNEIALEGPWCSAPPPPTHHFCLCSLMEAAYLHTSHTHRLHTHQSQHPSYSEASYAL